MPDRAIDGGGRAVEFNDLLGKEGIDPKTVLVLRHRPQQREIRKVLPWLAAERPDIYNAYQQQQSLSVEPAMVKPDFVASFIGHEAGKALFIGLYRRGQWRPLTHNEYWRVPANIEMRAFGMLGPVRGINSLVRSCTDCILPRLEGPPHCRLAAARALVVALGGPEPHRCIYHT